MAAMNFFEHQERARRGTSYLVLGFAGAVMTGVFVRHVSRPLRALQLGARRFADGKLDLKVPVPASEEIGSLAEALAAAGAHLHVPRADRDYAIAVGIRMLTLRHAVLEHDGLYRANPADQALLAYYANAIAPAVARLHLANRAAA